MTRQTKVFAVFAVLSLGLWGCAQGNGVPQAQSERIKQLEAKYARLETQSRGIQEAREQAAHEVLALREETASLQKIVEMQKNVIKERDALRLQVDARTVERDMLKNGMQTLLRQVDTAAPASEPTQQTGAMTKPSSNS